MKEERQDKLTPNSQRSLDERGQNPAELKEVANRLLRQVAYAVALTNPETARSMSASPGDREIHEDDEDAGEIMFTNAAVEGVTCRDSMIAPIVKALSRRRNQKVKENYELRSQKAGRKRLQHIGDYQALGKAHLTWRTAERTFPSRRGVPLSPLSIHVGAGARAVSLTPYQIQASGVIEIVRASGRVIGNCDGDWLADQFMRLLIDMTGREHFGASWEDAVYGLNGGFLDLAERGDEIDPDWQPLDGRSQMLAVTALAAWIRMSRLGVYLGNQKAAESWPGFFDGVIYGADPSRTGEIWSQKKLSLPKYGLAEPWRNTGEPPWVTDSSGSPVAAVGIAGEILRKAIIAVQPIGFVPDDFSVDEEGGADPVYEESNEILVQLKRHYREVAGKAIGSVISVSWSAGTP